MRYVKFNLNSLCHLVATPFGDATKCVRVVKLEGSFNKALLLTMDDGNEVIAKIPCPNAGPPSLTTASEVATLKFLRLKTSIRVPAVLAWSSDAANAIERELADISFPAYGSLFLRESLPATYRQYPLPPNLDREGLFCIGPSCKRTSWHGNSVDINQPLSEDMGPWVHFSEYALLIVQ
ncbi:hypothetical protein RU639_005913 [Aspergillus parasiticus]